MTPCTIMTSPEITTDQLAHLHRTLRGLVIGTGGHPFAEMLDLMHDAILRTDDPEDLYSLAEDICDLAHQFREMADEEIRLGQTRQEAVT